MTSTSTNLRQRMTDPAATLFDAGDGDPMTVKQRLEKVCSLYYPRVQAMVHQMLASDVRRGRPWLTSVLSTGDVVQEVFLGVVRDFEGFRGADESALIAYLARLVRNRLIDSVRHHEASRRDQRRRSGDAEAIVSEAVSPGARVRTSEDVDAMQRLLATLKDRDRALLRGRIEDGESFQQLADALGYASADSARKAFCAVQARLLSRLPVNRGDA